VVFAGVVVAGVVVRTTGAAHAGQNIAEYEISGLGDFITPLLHCWGQASFLYPDTNNPRNIARIDVAQHIRMMI